MFAFFSTRAARLTLMMFLPNEAAAPRDTQGLIPDGCNVLPSSLRRRPRSRRPTDEENPLHPLANKVHVDTFLHMAMSSSDGDTRICQICVVDHSRDRAPHLHVRVHFVHDGASHEAAKRPRGRPLPPEFEWAMLNDTPLESLRAAADRLAAGGPPIRIHMHDSSMKQPVADYFLERLRYARASMRFHVHRHVHVYGYAMIQLARAYVTCIRRTQVLDSHADGGTIGGAFAPGARQPLPHLSHGDGCWRANCHPAVQWFACGALGVYAPVAAACSQLPDLPLRPAARARRACVRSPRRGIHACRRAPEDRGAARGHGGSPCGRCMCMCMWMRWKGSGSRDRSRWRVPVMRGGRHAVGCRVLASSLLLVAGD